MKLKYNESSDKKIIAAFQYLSRKRSLYPLTHLNAEKEKRIFQWCELLGLPLEGSHIKLEKPTLNEFRKKLYEELQRRLHPRDFVSLTQPELIESIKSKTDQEISMAISKMIKSFPE